MRTFFKYLAIFFGAAIGIFYLRPKPKIEQQVIYDSKTITEAPDMPSALQVKKDREKLDEIKIRMGKY